MTEFCDAHGIGYERCGKVIVATDEEEVPRLNTLYERGTANGVPGSHHVEALTRVREELDRLAKLVARTNLLATDADLRERERKINEAGRGRPEVEATE